MARSQSAVLRLGGLAFVASLTLLGGCALDTDQRPEARTDGELAAADDTAPGETCTDGVVQECVIRLPSHDGVKTCFHGLKLCEDGQWSTCASADDIEQMLDDKS
jgi:hypothetical protein